MDIKKIIENFGKVTLGTLAGLAVMYPVAAQPDLSSPDIPNPSAEDVKTAAPQSPLDTYNPDIEGKVRVLVAVVTLPEKYGIPEAGTSYSPADRAELALRHNPLTENCIVAKGAQEAGEKEQALLRENGEALPQDNNSLPPRLETELNQAKDEIYKALEGIEDAKVDFFIKQIEKNNDSLDKGAIASINLRRKQDTRDNGTLEARMEKFLKYLISDNFSDKERNNVIEAIYDVFPDITFKIDLSPEKIPETAAKLSILATQTSVETTNNRMEESFLENLRDVMGKNLPKLLERGQYVSSITANEQENTPQSHENQSPVHPVSVPGGSASHTTPVAVPAINTGNGEGEATIMRQLVEAYNQAKDR